MKETSNYECAAEIREALTDLTSAVEDLDFAFDVRPLLAMIVLSSSNAASAPGGLNLADRVRNAVGTADLLLDYCAANPRRKSCEIV